MSAPSPRERMARAFRDRSDAIRRQRLTRQARGFRGEDPEKENVLRLRREDPAGHASLPASLLLAAGYYAEAKQAAADLADLDHQET